MLVDDDLREWAEDWLAWVVVCVLIVGILGLVVAVPFGLAALVYEGIVWLWRAFGR